jgi:2-keto-4-pentenoate hydratase/2-oxohepta-3-ene-1,7-dioic acid hydratase in catechol pathway
MIPPGKIIGVGRNYREHARELGSQVPAEPLIFLKPPSSVIHSGTPIVLPCISKQVDFEGEIGVVIGKRARRLSPEQARDVIAGVVAVNDVTARDLQRTDGQWARAKGFDTFCPVGPEVIAVDDFESLEIVTRVNGVERQRAAASQMVWLIPELVS